MEKSDAKNYYCRPEIQKAILKFAKDREIGVMFDGFFGKRPDVIENLYAVKKFVDKGVFSFHCSEERWANPLLLGDSKLSDEEKAKNRVGWDLILDLDGVDYVYSKFLGKVILDYFDSLGIRNVSVKFSGNKGFHIAIPFEAFSAQCPGLVAGISEARLLFPDVAKKTVLFLLHELKATISKVLLDYEGGGRKAIRKMSQKYGILEAELEYDEEKYVFNFMKVIDIDTILITSRHLFRMPYSLNEKSGLVSIPVKKEFIMDFERFMAKPEKVDPAKYESFEFLKFNPEFGQDGNILLQKVYEDEDYMHDAMYEDYEEQLKSKAKGEFVLEIDEEVEIKDFPQTIQYILASKFEDGKKRALFLLMTFLYSVKWDQEHVEQTVTDWNDMQDVPLKKNYIQAQFSWFRIQQKTISPPNFENENYFRGIGIPVELIDKDKHYFKSIQAKNPLHYVYLLLKSKKKTGGKGKK